ncbi:hypothetical protein HanIR_Chr09g0447011 [Helianthus annuus]|nr:hypothetical protein HanIR_Chr09g0447011 [Helianthus annuus]
MCKDKFSQPKYHIYIYIFFKLEALLIWRPKGQASKYLGLDALTQVHPHIMQCLVCITTKSKSWILMDPYDIQTLKYPNFIIFLLSVMSKSRLHIFISRMDRYLRKTK